MAVRRTQKVAVIKIFPEEQFFLTASKSQIQVCVPRFFFFRVKFAALLFLPSGGRAGADAADAAQHPALARRPPRGPPLGRPAGRAGGRTTRRCAGQAAETVRKTGRIFFFCVVVVGHFFFGEEDLGDFMVHRSGDFWWVLGGFIEKARPTLAAMPQFSMIGPLYLQVYKMTSGDSVLGRVFGRPWMEQFYRDSRAAAVLVASLAESPARRVMSTSKTVKIHWTPNFLKNWLKSQMSGLLQVSSYWLVKPRFVVLTCFDHAGWISPDLRAPATERADPVQRREVQLGEWSELNFNHDWIRIWLHFFLVKKVEFIIVHVNSKIFQRFMSFCSGPGSNTSPSRPCRTSQAEPSSSSSSSFFSSRPGVGRNSVRPWLWLPRLAQWHGNDGHQVGWATAHISFFFPPCLFHLSAEKKFDQSTQAPSWPIAWGYFPSIPRGWWCTFQRWTATWRHGPSCRTSVLQFSRLYCLGAQKLSRFWEPCHGLSSSLFKRPL